MSNPTLKRAPENLADFAQLANISTQSLEQILEKLKQAGIQINDPHEKLCSQTKAKLLAFFRGKTESPTIRQTRVSKLSSGADSVKQVKITSISRKPTPESTQDKEGAMGEEMLAQKDTTHLEETSTSDSVAIENKEPDKIEEISKKKQKITSPNKKLKADPTARLEKRNKHKLAPLAEEEIELNEHLKSTTTPRYPSTEETNHYPSTGPLTQVFKKPIKRISQDVWVPERITIADLAKKMSIKDVDVMTHLEKMGAAPHHYNEPIDQDTAVLLIVEMGHNPRLLSNNAEETVLREALDRQMGEPSKRAPIVTIMGHVDHGKTSLLDYIRHTQVVTQEKGGITQHIGAYQVELPKGTITFLDTPGHAAFTAMRARGAHLTDIVALVVAADDGVMPQTIEAIEHAKAANVPIVVAINKMDKPGITMELAQQGLAKYNLIPEEWGGETLFVPLSAKTGEGIDNLLEALLLQAEISELQAPIQGPAQGIVLESRLDKGQGPVATIVLKKGTLQKGDILLAGTSFGRARALNDAQGNPIASAGPSTPIEVLGLSHPPAAGEEAIVIPNERKAREIIQARVTARRTSQLQPSRSLEALINPFENQLKNSISVILKADVQGSAEALKESLLKLSTEAISIKPLMTGVGSITESDVNLAIASKAIIFGFNVRVDNIAKRLLQREKVVVHNRAIIYELLDEAQKMINNLLGPQTKETILGKACVREVFKTSKTSTVAGCTVIEGSITSHHNIRIIRDQAVIYQGKLSSLRRFKDDVKVVNTGLDCGINLKNYTDIKVGDIIESYDSILLDQKV